MGKGVRNSQKRPWVSKTYLPVDQVVAVHPDGAGLERVAHTDGRVKILGVHGGGEAVVGVVSELEDLRLVLELGDGADGAEDLLLCDLHLGRHVGEDGRLDEVALVAVALATSLDRRALVTTGLDVAHNAVVLQLADLRALEGVVGERVTDLVLLGTLPELSDELVVDALLHEDAGTSAAALPVVVVDAKVDPVDGVVDVGIVEHDVGRLAAQLERHLLQVRRRGRLHDLPADDGRSGEGNLVNIHVRREGGASGLAEAGDDVHDAWGEAGLLDKLCSHQGGEGGLLGRLQHNHVACCQRRADLPRPHEQREVPGDDLGADADLKGDELAKLSSYRLLSNLDQDLRAPTSSNGTCRGRRRGSCPRSCRPSHHNTLWHQQRRRDHHGPG